MLRIQGVLAAAALALGGCASPITPAMPAQSPSGMQAAGSAGQYAATALHVVPSGIVFPRGKTRKAVEVRVWQPHFEGRYRVINQCRGIEVMVLRYSGRNITYWSVGPHDAPAESCVVKFVGTAGPRGTGRLTIKVER
jgi:hypothetical protein